MPSHMAFKNLPRQSSPQLVSQTYQNISTLPDEILAEIFLALRYITTHRGIYEPSKIPSILDPEVRVPGLGSWIHVTCVCTHWRRVTLGTPHLWSTISLSDPTRALTMLKRCKDVSLEISCDMKTTPLSVFDVSTIISSISRQIRVLEIKANESDLATIALSLSSIPGLKELTFVTLSTWTKPEGFRWPDMPALRRLNNQGSTFPNIDFPPLPCLKQFKNLTQRVPLHQLIKLFRNAPALEEVETGVSSHEGSGYTGPPQIRLPMLRKVSLIMRSLREIELFDHLNLPSITQIVISSSFLPRIESEHLLVLHNISSQFILNGPSFPLVTRLKLHPDEFSINLSWVFPSQLFSLDNPSLQILLSGMQADLTVLHLELCSLLPYENTHTLDLSITNAPSVATVTAQILPLLSRLERFLCTSSDTFDPLIALAIPVAGNMPNPKLKTLSLTRHRSFVPSIPSPSPSDFFVLKDIIRERAVQGFPIKQVTLMSPVVLLKTFLSELRACNCVVDYSVY